MKAAAQHKVLSLVTRVILVFLLLLVYKFRHLLVRYVPRADG